MAVCSPFDTDEFKNENKYTNVEYSADGSSLTIYLDGSARVPVNRALSKKLAILGHDFFEATFMYRNSSGAYSIARGSWELGEPAGINGLWRGENGGGADYGALINSTLGNDTGTAILFAGKKTDKTLLAVGSLTGVDGGTSKVISSTTKSVSFALNALKAGAISARSLSDTVDANVSILTDSGSTSYGTNVRPSYTNIRNINIAHRLFPAYVIPITKSYGPANNRTQLRYAIDVAGNPGDSRFTPPTTGQLTGNCFEYYRSGIVNANQSLRSVVNIEPHFTEVNAAGQGIVYKYDTPFIWHTPQTSVDFDSVTTAGTVLPNPIYFQLSPAGGSDNYIFSFAFQLPVNALSNDSNPVTWFIRNGYDKYVEELDNGYNGSGGAILIAIGNVESPQQPWLEISQRPKTQYNPGNVTPGYGDYEFNVEALQLIYHTGLTSPPAQPVIPPGNIASEGIIFEYSIDEVEWTPILPHQSFPPPTTSQDYKIRITWPTHPTDYAFYTVTVSSSNSVDPGQLDANNRFVISSPESWRGFLNTIQQSSRQGVYLAVFSVSFDIPPLILNIAGDFTLIITANQPGVVIGREVPPGYNPNMNTITFNGPPGQATANVVVFMGKWPFDEPVMAGGALLVDYPFNVSARDTFANYGVAPGRLTGNMFAREAGKGSLTVQAPGVTINYPGTIPYP